MQGMKKGVIELADLLVVNKADGDNKMKAMAARAEMLRVLQYLRAATEGWPTPALLASALTGEGVADVWKSVEDFFRTARMAGVLDQRRRSQAVAWMHSLVSEALLHDFYSSPGVKLYQPEIERAVADGRMPAVAAARELLKNATVGDLK
jgi:LAO/AO transport system kinase